MTTWLSFNKLNTISEDILNNIDLFFEYFRIELSDNFSNYSGFCPIHGESDNLNAFLMYKNSGTWICNTHGCHNIFRKTPIGLIRGILSSQKLGWASHVDSSKIYSFNKTMEFIENFLKERPINTEEIKHKNNKRKQLQINSTKELKISIDSFLRQIKTPSEYFINRGFDEEVLKKYYVGTNLNKNTPLANRELVPILDNTGSFIIGCSARTNKAKCLVCSGYHDPLKECPDPKYNPKAYQKWAHSKGFKRTNYLYNYWIASKEYKKYNNEVILVEGPLEVWKLSQSGYSNGLAMFGSDLTQEQANLIHNINPSKIITIMDNDDGGLHAEESCKKLLNKYDIQSIYPYNNDLGEMGCQEIKQMLSSLE